jgi:heterodisulfide reductase subunit A-like polyferredoxin
MASKPRFVMCICTGECPGFAQLNLWELVNRVRRELDVEYAIVHPQLCVDDGDRFWQDYVKPGALYVVGACDPKMQRKMFRDAFAAKGADFDHQVVPLDLRNMSTSDAFAKVAEAVAALMQEVRG